MDDYDVHNRRFMQPTEEEMDAYLKEQFGTVNDTSHDTLTERLTSVQRSLKAPKNQKNTFGGYNYRSCEDILEAAKPLLADHGLTLTITDDIVHFPSAHPTQAQQVKDSKGNVVTELVDGDRFYVKATAIIRDASGAEVSVSAWARESPNKKGMDDSQITGSASSYARKYALNGLFLIDDTKDADTDEHGTQRQNAGRAVAEGVGITPQRPAQRPSDASGDDDTPPPPKGGRPASEKQVNAVFAIAKRAGANPEEWAVEANADGTDTLSAAQASWLIEKYGGPR